MRKHFLPLLLRLFAIPMLTAAPSVQAADLGVTPVKRAHHKRLHVVRDYDGTPVVVYRIAPVTVRGFYGEPIVLSDLYHRPVFGPQPAYYFNGQPVLPNYPIY
jgi:hypothetical protein